MIIYNRKNITSISFKDKSMDEVDLHGDIALDFLEHYSYTKNLDLLDIGELDDGTHIKECDYCGKHIVKNCHWDAISTGGRGGKVSQKYVDKTMEYPYTDDCCFKCIYKKNMITHFLNNGSVKNIKGFLTKQKNGKVPTSRQQIYLSTLLKADLNKYYKDVGFVDMVLSDKKIAIEYDGSGHYLGIQFGKYTLEEKMRDDFKRDEVLKENFGYKVIRISSKYDYLPSDEVITSKIGEIENYFKESNKKFYLWEIPSSKKDLTYGKLREIKDDDLSR